MKSTQKEKYFTPLFEKWWNHTKTNHQILEIQQTSSIPRLFSTEDSWKSADSDYSYDNKITSIRTLKEDISDYLEQRFNEELDFTDIFTIHDLDETDIFEYFNIWYDDWMELQIDTLTHKLELEF